MTAKKNAAAPIKKKDAKKQNSLVNSNLPASYFLGLKGKTPKPKNGVTPDL